MAYIYVTGIKPVEIIKDEEYRKSLDEGLNTTLKKGREELNYKKQHPGESPIFCLENSRYINGRCVCDEGYVLSGNEMYVGDPRKVVCITITSVQNCQNIYGTESYAAKEGDKYVCYFCKPGYKLTAGKTCALIK
jgi:hypothetical protein